MNHTTVTIPSIAAQRRYVKQKQRGHMFTAQHKLEAVQREITQRERVYPRLVAAGKMSRYFADRQIALMRAIEADYQQIVDRKKEPGLFG